MEYAGALKMQFLDKAYVLTILIFRDNNMEHDFSLC